MLTTNAVLNVKRTRLSNLPGEPTVRPKNTCRMIASISDRGKIKKTSSSECIRRDTCKGVDQAAVPVSRHAAQAPASASGNAATNTQTETDCAEASVNP